MTEKEPKKYEKWVRKKAELLEEIESLEHQSGEMLLSLKKTPKHIAWAELEDKDRFNRLLPGRKRLMDRVIDMLARGFHFIGGRHHFQNQFLDFQRRGHLIDEFMNFQSNNIGEGNYLKKCKSIIEKKY